MTIMDKKLNLTTLVSLAIPYGFVLASIYLYAHWRPIGINPFQYANAADLTSSTMGALVTFFLGVAAGVVLSALADGNSFSEEVADQKFTRGQLIAAVLIVMLALAGVVLLWWHDFPIKFLGIGLIVYTIILIRLRRIDWYYKVFPTAAHRKVVPMIVFMMPFGMVDMGSYDLKRILDAKSGNVVDLRSSSLPVKIEGTVIYVGALGEFHVLRQIESKTTVVVPAESGIVFKADRGL